MEKTSEERNIHGLLLLIGNGCCGKRSISSAAASPKDNLSICSDGRGEERREKERIIEMRGGKDYTLSPSPFASSIDFTRTSTIRLPGED